MPEFGRVYGRRKLRVNVSKSKVMRCTRYVIRCRIMIRWSKRIVSSTWDRKWQQMEDVEGMWYTERMRGIKRGGALKIVLCNRGLGVKAKKCLYQGVIVSTAIHAAEAWSVRSADRRNAKVLEIKYLRVWWEYHKWIELGMKRCIEEL